MLLISSCDTYSQKRCLDHNDLNNYRPVSNLCFIANVLEKLVLSQVSSYLNSRNLCNTYQSAYRPGHSTETALLKVVYDLFLSLNKGNISVLALLDFSSAFDTIDHPILVYYIYTDFGFTDTVLQWFSCYLTDSTQYVSLYNHCSAFAICCDIVSATNHIPSTIYRTVSNIADFDSPSFIAEISNVLVLSVELVKQF